MNELAKIKLREIQYAVEDLCELVPEDDGLTSEEYEILAEVQNLKEILERNWEVFNG